MKQVVTASGFQEGLGGRTWSPALKVGPWLLISGVTAVDYEGGENVGVADRGSLTPAKLDAEAQWRQVLGNIQALVEAAGGTMADVVLANVFVTDMHYYTDYEWIRQEYFVEPYPVSTAVEVGRLVHPDWIVEIEVMAYIEEGQ